eukprot:Opistho-2@57538
MSLLCLGLSLWLKLHLSSGLSCDLTRWLPTPTKRVVVSPTTDGVMGMDAATNAMTGTRDPPVSDATEYACCTNVECRVPVVRNTMLFRRYSSQGVRGACTVRIYHAIKRWARVCRVSGNYHGYPSNYAFLTMLVAYLVNHGGDCVVPKRAAFLDRVDGESLCYAIERHLLSGRTHASVSTTGLAGHSQGTHVVHFDDTDEPLPKRFRADGADAQPVDNRDNCCNINTSNDNSSERSAESLVECASARLLHGFFRHYAGEDGCAFEPSVSVITLLDATVERAPFFCIYLTRTQRRFFVRVGHFHRHINGRNTSAFSCRPCAS